MNSLLLSYKLSRPNGFGSKLVAIAYVNLKNKLDLGTASRDVTAPVRSVTTRVDGV